MVYLSWDCPLYTSKLTKINKYPRIEEKVYLCSQLDQQAPPILHAAQHEISISLLNQIFLNWNIFIEWYLIRTISWHVVCMEGAMEPLHLCEAGICMSTLVPCDRTNQHTLDYAHMDYVYQLKIEDRKWLQFQMITLPNMTPIPV